MFAYDPRFNDRRYCKTQVGAGWATLIDRCFEICEGSGLAFQVIQVKEKFGGLRFYVDFTPDAASFPGTVEALRQELDRVAAESYTACEVCGEPGTRDTAGGWYRTLCEQHAAERLE